MEFSLLLEVLKDYDLPTILMGVVIYSYLNKKLNAVDKAVNCRPADSMTISQEVSEIHRKVDVSAIKQEYIAKELDAHRDVDEKEFKKIYLFFQGHPTVSPDRLQQEAGRKAEATGRPRHAAECG